MLKGNHRLYFHDIRLELCFPLRLRESTLCAAKEYYMKQDKNMNMNVEQNSIHYNKKQQTQI